MSDILIQIIDRDRVFHNIDVPTEIDLNLMELAKANNLPVAGTCGGMALCASCHVYVNSTHDLPPPSEDELAMLDQAFYVETNSRLSCQIKINASLDGLQVTLAPVGL
ncbi:MAG: 2Fe-2S iron-sulfur cluster-binding protein [Saprospiraceae bacterium]|nr:2Fe-2S iron-sulfur cluster-binding protein [Saprospiraceae bacterium]